MKIVMVLDMGSLILTTAVRLILPLMLLFSIFVLLRGHNEPGGGFIGGLVAAAAYALYGFAFGPAEVRRSLLVNPRLLIGVGLTVAVSSALLSFITGQPFMTGLWYENEIPVIGKLGTPLLFDVGVYTVVLGITLLIVFSLQEED
jgi:multicomponent Na+:H+ antiporter subunit B